MRSNILAHAAGFIFIALLLALLFGCASQGYTKDERCAIRILELVEHCKGDGK